MITMELYELKNLCMEMSELGVANYVKTMAPADDLLSQRKAYELFGESRVKRWIAKSIITPVREGASANSKKYFSRAELMAAHQAEKLEFMINR